MAASPVVSIEGVGRCFGERAALDGISTRIEPGELVAIVGRSGAGKTTLLRCLSRSLDVTTGAIRFGADDIAGFRGGRLRAHRARVGMIYQQFNLVKRLRVVDNVLVGRLPHLRGWRRSAALARWFERGEREIALRCLDHVGLLARAWQRTDTLSGGEQQRVAIARILAQSPAVILGDEPVASLDVANGAMVMELLRQIAGQTGLTVIATLHHVEYARRYADRVLGLSGGRLVWDGRAGDLTEAVVAGIFGEAPERGREPRPVPAGEPQWVAS